ncbi:MAG: NADPH:quinone oxidoreductase family protein [Myxococcales bacterium]|nr:NADPH:quinone oxidoreductase family protein [Myxococcales bacterium]
MKAWRVHECGEMAGPGGEAATLLRSYMRWEQCEDPLPPDAGVVIEVGAAGLNFPDLLLMAGKYQVSPPLPFVPGMEAAGTVVAVGAQSRYKVGQRVIANGVWGAFGTHMAAPDTKTFALPDEMSDGDAAAIHVIYQTSYMGLVYRANLQSGETLLVHGGSGGVGTSAIQIGKALGARVIATASSAEKLEVCKRAGADELINYKETDFVEAVKDLTDGEGADVIYDPVGGDVFDKSSRCIAFAGRLLVIGFASGRIPGIAANRILLKNISIVGLHWVNYNIKAPELVQRTHLRILELYRNKKIRPLICSERPMTELPEALAQVAERRSWGKLVVVNQ